MPTGISLRAVARALHYAPSTLVEARNNGYFSALPDGSYSLEEVRAGLLANSSPRDEHRKILERGPNTDSASTFGPATEAAIAASTDPVHTQEAHEAFVVLAELPAKMAKAFNAHSPLQDPEASKPVFFDVVQTQLGWYFEQLSDQNSEFATLVARDSLGRRKSK